MALTSTLLASGTDWQVSEVLCTAGPRDRSYVEQHSRVSIALVTAGSFRYRTSQGAAFMAPGSLLLGNAGACFECGHEHGHGDRCLAFHFSPRLFESIVAAVPGARRMEFNAPRLPPVPAVLPVLAAAQAARGGGNEEYRELAYRLAGAVCAALGEPPGSRRSPSARDEKRVAAALRRIEAQPGRLSVDALASEAAVSVFHFLRIFEQVVGVTPGQYMLRRRLHRAAMRLRGSGEGIASVALESGFEDLSTFNRQFRRATGMTPGAFRARRFGAG